MANILQQVQTYNDSGLGALMNLMCFVSNANTKFKNFQETEANLGDTVTFDKPPRFRAASGLSNSGVFGDVEQRVQSLTVNQAYRVDYAFTAQQFIFNVDEYMDKFGKGAMIELASQVEANVAGLAETTAYRYFGDGVTNITTYTQLAQANAKFKNFGAAKGQLKVFLPDLIIPSIIGSGLSQFATNRNNEIANSWELGTFGGAEYFTSNLLPVHTAGVAGDTPVVDDISITGISGDGTQITLHSATRTSITNFIRANDTATIKDTNTGAPKLVFLTFTGHSPTQQSVQFRATASANLDGSGNVTVSIDPPLISDSNSRNQNLSKALTTDSTMKVNFLPSHRCGLIVGDNAFYVAMPRLPEQVPFPSYTSTDADSGVSLRMTHGSVLGQNTMGNIHDVVWGATAVPEYCMKIALPLTVSDL